MLHNNLVYYRKKKKMTQLDVSERIGVSRPAYTAYEKGTRTPDISIQYKLADLFNITLDELHGRKTKEKLNLLEDAEVLMFSDKDGWDELSDDRKKEIMRELSDLADFYIEKDKKAKGDQ
ncbi:helix-turn-helix transcriptional regulator [Mammaliicoccus sciuri]|uniref:helix-turn-helix transcriptional regulator n=1 Tax=Mammaliicoccus sciuri TaxID=1296 RepID=UPI001FB2C9D3|nr:helix-turn-helix domain-containing protein [Mammaliicoccus sciuri]MCJ1773154.1 helix-turn-helix domain-containing protein [Mammaliicoccus sciuri]